MSSPLRVVPETVLRSSHTPVPASTPTATSPEAVPILVVHPQAAGAAEAPPADPVRRSDRQGVAAQFDLGALGQFAGCFAAVVRLDVHVGGLTFLGDDFDGPAGNPYDEGEGGGAGELGHDSSRCGMDNEQWVWGGRSGLRVARDAAGGSAAGRAGRSRPVAVHGAGHRTDQPGVDRDPLGGGGLLDRVLE